MMKKYIRGGNAIAIFSLNINIISRGKGKSVIAAAAYRAGETIKSDYDGQTHDYSNKKGIAYTEIMLPENAPDEYSDRAALWNAVEKIEKVKNAQLAREVRLALPAEFYIEQNIALVREYIKKSFVNVGMCADICIHDNGNGNPHAHCLLTMRPFEQDGSWGAKAKKVYVTDKSGERIKLPSGNYKTKRINTTEWDNRLNADLWREGWAIILNRYLKDLGYETRVDHRSYERQGKEQIPTIHLGVVAHGLEKRGIRTERGDINREINAANAKLKALHNQIMDAAEAKAMYELFAELETQKAEIHIPSPPPKPENELQQLKNEQRQENTQPKQDIPTTPQKTAKAETQSKPTQKPKTLQQVDKEIATVETKLQHLDFADQVLMGYYHKIQDIQRNLSSAGFFERRKMEREIETEKQRRDSYKADTVKKYGTKSQLENEKSKLLKEKKQIEDTTGITAAREREQQRIRSEAWQQRQERDLYHSQRQQNRGYDDHCL